MRHWITSFQLLNSNANMRMAEWEGKPRLQTISPHLAEIRFGRVAPLGVTRTGYAKTPAIGAVRAHELGLVGDEQGNLRMHGGPEKALYAYTVAHYAAWVAELPQHAGKLIPGGFGENLVVAGLDEASLCIGDRWRAGEVVMEVCQPRNPCSTMAAWFDDAGMPKRFLARRRSGWYCRVIQPGLMAAGDALTLERRLDGAWTIARLLAVADGDDPDLLEVAAAHDRLAGEWATGLARQALAMRRRAATRSAA